MTKFKHSTRLRQILDDMLACDQERPVNELEWSELEQDGSVEEMTSEGPAAFARAFNTLRRRRQAYGGYAARAVRPAPPMFNEDAAPPRADLDQKSPDRQAHEWAMSFYYFQIASDPSEPMGHGLDVERFRRDFLRGLLKYDYAAIQGWLAYQPSEPIGASARPNARRSRPLSDADVFSCYLEYQTPLIDWVQRFPVVAESRLDRLRLLSEQLASFYPWSKSQATIFVLTGLTPWVESIRTETKVRSPFPTRSRITLTVDPTCTPQEVAAAYAEARRADLPFKGRVRRLSEKHAFLAAFAVDHRELPEQRRFEEWNRWCEAEGKANHWKYTHPSLFARDARQAIKRLYRLILGPTEPRESESEALYSWIKPRATEAPESSRKPLYTWIEPRASRKRVRR